MAKKSQDQSNGTAATQGDTTINKTAALKEALQVMGLTAKNEELEKYILQKYGKDAVSANISVAKSSILKKMGKNPRRKKRRGGRRPKDAVAQQPVVAAPVRAVTAPATISLQAAQTVKDLVGELGADTVKGLADLFEGK